MKRKRFSVEQITGILKQAEMGTPVQELCRSHVMLVLEQHREMTASIAGGNKELADHLAQDHLVLFRDRLMRHLRQSLAEDLKL